jgi:hypothetical protein
MASALRAYFDRQTGAFPQMVETLVKQGGSLDAMLRRHLEADGSTLAKTLVHHVGSESPLLRLLSPEQKGGVLAQLQSLVEAALAEQRRALLSEFDLNNAQGALGRLVTQMKEGRDSLDQVFQQTVGRLAKEFSLDHEDSGLVRFKREIGGLLQGFVEQQTSFRQEVLAALEGLRARRAAEAETTLKGGTFEEAMHALLQREAERGGDVLEETGTLVGDLKHCKKGDFVLHLGAESAGHGERIVVEAKNEAGHSLKDALDEMAQARPNRRAQHGVFVFHRAVAPPGLPPLRRCGDDVVVLWDPDDPSTDLWLRAALEITRALTVRRARADRGEAASLEAMDRLLAQLEKDAGSLDRIVTSANTITSSASRILGEAESLRKKVASAVADLRQQVEGLRTPG